MEENIYLNPLEDRIIGIIENKLYFKPKYRDYIIVTTENEHLKLLKGYIKTKRDFCKRYNHFCGVFGEFTAKKYKKVKSDFKLNEPFDVEDDGKNDGLEMKEISYPVYFVYEFEMDFDMEHG